GGVARRVPTRLSSALAPSLMSVSWQVLGGRGTSSLREHHRVSHNARTRKCRKLALPTSLILLSSREHRNSRKFERSRNATSIILCSISGSLSETPSPTYIEPGKINLRWTQ